MYGFRHDTSWIASASQAIRSLLADASFDFGSAGPRLIRLAAHVAMSYDPADTVRPGGSQRSTIGEATENGYGEHNGLQDVEGRLATIHAQHPESTISDIYILAGNLAIEHLGGPALASEFCSGRDNVAVGTAASVCPFAGRLPGGSDSITTIRQIFARLGVDDDRGIVALLGAHSVGFTHSQFSNYPDRPWDDTPLVWDTRYYEGMSFTDWQHRTETINGVTQSFWEHEDCSRCCPGRVNGIRNQCTASCPNYQPSLVCETWINLEADMIIRDDPGMLAIAQEYVQNPGQWDIDFALAWKKITENGVPCTGGSHLANSDTLCEGVTGDECIFQCAAGFEPIGNHICGCGTFAGGSCQEIDECQTAPCQNGGTCTDGIASFECACPFGYTGEVCDVTLKTLHETVTELVSTDECLSTPCQNGGSCKDDVDGYSCNCLKGFTGFECEIDDDECAAQPCKHGATCTAGDGRFVCACVYGYVGDTCEINVDDCAAGPCRGGAECIDLVSGYRCTCEPGYTGDHCYEDIDECLSTPCQHGGSCKDEVDRYSCECSAGFSGFDCEHDFDDCADQPCQNNGVCAQSGSSFACQCVDGWEGTTCELDVNECASDPCSNGACIEDTIDSWACHCFLGFSGHYCDEDVNECLSSPCQNGAVCTDKHDDYDCDCHAGFRGHDCEHGDACADQPCHNNGACEQSGCSFTCQCLDGWEGTTCEVDVDECASDPCMNGRCIEDTINH